MPCWEITPPFLSVKQHNCTQGTDKSFSSGQLALWNGSVKNKRQLFKKVPQKKRRRRRKENWSSNALSEESVNFMESVTKQDARNLHNRSWGKVINSESSVECFEIPCKSALWSVADTACCVLLHLQPHHAICYSHTTLWPVTATSHHGLLPPHSAACYSHIASWSVTTT